MDKLESFFLGGGGLMSLPIVFGISLIHFSFNGKKNDGAEHLIACFGSSITCHDI